jgi:O-antigen/teichoic acid export membrane protein
VVGNILRGFYSITGARIARIALYVLLTPIIVRMLGPAYGDYAFVLSIWALVMVIPAGGVFTGVRKFISERRGDGWETSVFGFYTLVTVLFCIVVAVCAAIALSTGIVQEIGGEFATYTVLLVLMIWANSFMNLVRSGLVALRKESISESLFAVQMFLNGAVGILLATFGWAVAGFLVGHVVGTLVVLLAMVSYLSRSIELTDLFSPRKVSLPSETIISFSLLSIVLTLLMESLYNIDLLLIRLLLGQEATAHYKASLLVAEFLWVIPIGIQQVLLHSSSELWAEQDVERIQTLSSKVTRYSLLLTALLSIGIAVLAEEFVGVYFGPGFDAAVLPMLVLLPGVFAFAVARGIYSIGHGKGEMRILILATGAAAGLNLVLNVLLIPQFGILGAAIATSVGYGSMFVFHLVGARSIGFDPLGDIRLGPTIVTIATTAIVLVAVDQAIASELLRLLLIPPVGLVLFTLLSIKTGALDEDEVRYVTGGVFDLLPV